MRNISYGELLDNIGCGLVIFLEDDFTIPPTFNLNLVLYRSVRLDNVFFGKLYDALHQIDITFADDLKKFVETFKKGIHHISNWNDVIKDDVESALDVIKTQDEPLFNELTEIYKSLNEPENEDVIYAEEQTVDFGDKIKGNGKYPLTSHKSFVVLECVDRLLTDGYLPEQITLGSDHDIEIDGKTFIDCVAWDDYCHDTHGEGITYTSRLVSGLLEYKGAYSKNGVVCFKNRANATLAPVMQPYLDGNAIKERLQPLETVIDFMGTTTSAKDELAELLGDRTLFTTPKPVKMIKEFIRSSGKSDAIVMDFFAGSGTTGHAMLELNHEDGGNRRFILITNNESDICRRVTIPRVKAAMQKYKVEDGSLETKLL